jgi:hypothetical protein
MLSQARRAGLRLIALMPFAVRLVPCAARLRAGRKIVPDPDSPKQQSNRQKDSGNGEGKNQKARRKSLQQRLRWDLGDENQGKKVNKYHFQKTFKDVQRVSPDFQEIVKNPSQAV